MSFFFQRKKERTELLAHALRPIVLIILDGYGISPIREYNAVFSANTPNIENYQKKYPKALLNTAGNEVGLPFGEFGNSEVGHLNIGSGRIVYQPLLRVNNEIEAGHLYNNEVLEDLKKHLKKNKGQLHLFTLLSAGGVHSHIEQTFAVLEWAAKNNIKNIRFHIFTDGRDAPPTSGEQFIESLQSKIKEIKADAKIATIGGRYFGMDRDKHWDRIKKAYDVMVGQGKCKREDPLEVLQENYQKNITDEFIPPTQFCDDKKNPIGEINSGDGLLFLNIRPDRSRQIVSVFDDSKFKKFKTKKLSNIYIATLTEYDEFKKVHIVFPEPELKNTLGEILSNHKKKQFHIAETEKYAHVTYFFNGGVEKPFKGETRIIIPSPKVPTYDKKPEMSAYKVAKRVLEELDKNKEDFYAINFANPDMVGHTGNFKAVVKALEAVDECVGLVVKKVLELGGGVVISADHGNAESIKNVETDEKDTEHNIYPAPMIVIAKELENKKETKGFKEMITEPIGSLCDIAPTILDLMKIKKPEEMTGTSLLNSLK